METPQSANLASGDKRRPKSQQHQASLTLPDIPTQLLRGFPGREISGAKTDPCGWIGDYDEPDILNYPEDASRNEFHQHPLANLTGLSLTRQAELGLILPKELKSRDTYFEYDTDAEEATSEVSSGSLNKTSRSASASVSSSGTDVLHKVKSWARFRSSSKPIERSSPFNQEKRQTPSPQTPDLPERPSTSFRLRSVRSISALRRQATPTATTLRSKRTKGFDKTQISRPLDCKSSVAVSTPGWGSFSSSNSASQSSGSSVDQTQLNNVQEDDQTQSFEGDTQISPRQSTQTPEFLRPGAEDPPIFHITAPRLSPMEYARTYLINKSIADREGRECEVERPELQAFYTPNHEKFYIFPKIPSSVPRQIASSSGPSVIGPAEQADQAQNHSGEQSFGDTSGFSPDQSGQYCHDGDSYATSEASEGVVLGADSFESSPYEALSVGELAPPQATMSEESIPTRPSSRNNDEDDMADDASIHSGDSRITSFHRGQPVRTSSSLRDQTPRSSGTMPSPGEASHLQERSSLQEYSLHGSFNSGTSSGSPYPANGQETAASGDQAVELPNIWRAAAEKAPPTTAPPARPLPPLPTVRRHSPLRMSIILPRMPDPEHLTNIALRSNLIPGVG
ncbi:hypothetical protein F5X68DRAFT_265507 [Plectosphaerella plurivora]|uniref:Uncharacterized protein n=1 Tax=Plectosphaerella plurivora TaxID=936078 RepID=A0A9P8V1Z6_9PEZI|nr:hypothetical protein F5X68DRAFT_265507 [Plectosphaerella plurivora]